jgi:hypothetical protein
MFNDIDLSGNSFRSNQLNKIIKENSQWRSKMDQAIEEFIRFKRIALVSFARQKFGRMAMKEPNSAGIRFIQ